MKMIHKSIEDLGFPQVLKQIENHTLSEEGRLVLHQLGFTLDRESFLARQQDVAAFVAVLSQLPSVNLSHFPPINDLLRKVADPVKTLEGNELLDVALYVDNAQQLSQLCATELDNSEASQRLSRFMGEIDPELLAVRDQIHQTLDEAGQVRQTHPALARLYKEIEARKSERACYCGTFIKTNRQVVQTDQEALRDGRLVIPVRSDRHAQIEGFITSSSSSGSTVFMEPYALVEMNNAVVMAQNQLLIEIAKIFRQLNEAVRRKADALLAISEQVGQVDAHLAIAAWVRELHCTKTELDGQGCVLLKARHPLLGRKAIPITMSLDSSVKAVVISGPNAGGKTVTVKTVGLFALLNQFCGFLPVSEGSSLPLFDAVYTDIGDEQSIEAQLSTFSGHMKQIGFILSSITDRSLVILDELGSGTDPVEGSAIARSVLEYCLEKAGLTLVTSHHGVLKQFAYAASNVINASMEFDEKSHQPTFRIIQGLPGESHALDTARMMKLPKQVIQRAEKYLGTEAVQITTIIKELEAKRRDLEKQQDQMHKRYLKLQDEVRQLQLKELRVKQREAQLKDEQTTELSRFLQQKRKELEHLVAEVKTGELTKEKTKKVKAYLKEVSDKLEDEQQKLDLVEEELEGLAVEDPKQLEVGMDVLCGSARREGKILEKKGKDKFVVAIGTMRMTLASSQIFLPKRQLQMKVSVQYHSSAPEPRLVLDVRGLTLEETLHQLDDQIERALVHGMTTFSIIHGYGDGILSKGIGMYLRNHPSVKDYRFALPEDGGMGKTYVML